MQLAIEGCVHGQLSLIYKVIQIQEEVEKKKIDALLLCGDFQAFRNSADLSSTSIPQKYMADVGDFYKYYSGELKAPILTILIGGNHESSNYMRELMFGGWLAPNIYYLGSSGVITLKKGPLEIKVGGISGIYKRHHFTKGYYEAIPISDFEDQKSVYHVREFDIFKMSLYSQNKLDILLTHDWPKRITYYGDWRELIKIKPYFHDLHEMGNPGTTYVMKKIKPKYIFAGHMHVKFAAIYVHNDKNVTKFLALDKPLPMRPFYQFIKIGEEIPGNENAPVTIQLDQEWLKILHVTKDIFPYFGSTNFLYYEGKSGEFVINTKAAPLEHHLLDLIKKIENIDISILPHTITVPPEKPQQQLMKVPPNIEIQQQTKMILQKLGYKIEKFENICYSSSNELTQKLNSSSAAKNDEEMDLEFSDEDKKEFDNVASKKVKIISEEEKLPFEQNTFHRLYKYI